MKRFGEHFKGNVVAYLALFFALGSSAMAATQLAKNSVGTKQLKNNAVVSKKVKDGSLLAGDFAAGQIPDGPKGATGTTGSTGPTGKDGIQGVVGPTQGFASPKQAEAEPPVTPELLVISQSIDLDSGGRLFVFGRGEFTFGCSTGTEISLGLYVDGVAASASGQRIPVSVDAKFSIWGISAPVNAGEHTIAVGLDCVSGTKTGGSSGGDGALGAILLGS